MYIIYIYTDTHTHTYLLRARKSNRTRAAHVRLANAAQTLSAKARAPHARRNDVHDISSSYTRFDQRTRAANARELTLEARAHSTTIKHSHIRMMNVRRRRADRRGRFPMPRRRDDSMRASTFEFKKIMFVDTITQFCEDIFATYRERVQRNDCGTNRSGSIPAATQNDQISALVA